MANSGDPDEMPHHAAFHQSHHCLLRLKQHSCTEVQLYLEILTCRSLISAMNHPSLIVSKQTEEFISIQRVRIIN